LQRTNIASSASSDRLLVRMWHKYLNCGATANGTVKHHYQFWGRE